MNPPFPQVLAFDVFGTVVDWHGGIRRAAEEALPGADGAAFALAWRAGYKPAMARVTAGIRDWATIDDLHREILDDLLPRFGGAALDEERIGDLNRAWHRLDPWPDAVAGLTRLKSRYLICTLSNGNLGLLTRMAKRAGLPWDCVLSAEVFRQYKPHPDTYLGVARTFDLEPSQVMLVAAHQDDLDAARGCGLQTAFVERPYEYGARRAVAGSTENTVNARDFHDLADRLGCDPRQD